MNEAKTKLFNDISGSIWNEIRYTLGKDAANEIEDAIDARIKESLEKFDVSEK